MAQTMKALVKREAGKGIWMEDVPVPAPGPNEVLIKLEKTAICGTDLHIYLWDEWSQRTIKPGLVIGHEFVGRIAIGRIFNGRVKIGDPVCVCKLDQAVQLNCVFHWEFPGDRLNEAVDDQRQRQPDAHQHTKGDQPAPRR